MDSPENSSFDEMSCTLSMGWDVDGLETAPGTRTQQAHTAWRTDCLGSAKGFARRSFGSDTEGAPPERASDDQFSDAVHAGH